ncbi:MAG: helix-turn-helix domain-containing protein [Lachnospiraceae bacterium]|nr:helix-turn-helix domain-containing protein [Lachnospiraceae bacterium]
MENKAFDQGLLGKRIREVRKSNGYTTRGAADQLNISQTYLRQIESGKSTKTPSLAVFVSICNLFHISPDYLLQDQLVENELSAVKDAAALYKKTSYSTQKVVLAMLNAAMEELEKQNQDPETAES